MPGYTYFSPDALADTINDSNGWQWSSSPNLPGWSPLPFPLSYYAFTGVHQSNHNQHKPSKSSLF